MTDGMFNTASKILSQKNLRNPKLATNFLVFCTAWKATTIKDNKKAFRSMPGIEPGTSCTRSRNHASRPHGRVKAAPPALIHTRYTLKHTHSPPIVFMQFRRWPHGPLFRLFHNLVTLLFGHKQHPLGQQPTWNGRDKEKQDNRTVFQNCIRRETVALRHNVENDYLLVRSRAYLFGSRDMRI